MKVSKKLKHYIYCSRHILMGIFAVAILFGNSVRALAGDINGEEARIISAASGVFYYNNEAYAAKSEYISQLTGYLAQDGVDLTAGQADAAISEMYGSIAQGVAEGYLYKIETTESGTTEATTETSKPPVMEIPTEATTEQTQTTEATTEADTEAVTTTETAEAPSTTETVISQIAEEKADGKVTYDVQNHTMVYENKKDNEVKTLPSVEHPLDVTKYVTIGTIIILLMLALILLLCFGLYIGKCFPWQKKKRNRKTARYYVNHRMRSTYRKISGNLFTGMITCHVFVCVLLLSVGLGVFRESFVIDNLTSSGYYRYVYDDMKHAIQRELADTEPEQLDLLMQQMGYDVFLTTAKQQVKSSLSGTLLPYDGSAFAEKLMQVECGITNDEQQICVNVILGNLQTYAADMVGSSIYGIKEGYRDFAMRTLPIMGINMLLMVVVAILMDRYHHRGVRYVARGVLAGAGAALVLSIVFYLWKPYSRIYIQPSSLYLFLKDYIQHAVLILGAVASIVILLGVLLMTLVGIIRKKQMEDN